MKITRLFCENNFLVVIICVLFWLSPFAEARGDDFHNKRCGEPIKNRQDLTLATVDVINPSFETYEKENDRIKVGTIDSNLVRYVYIDKKFYGVKIPVVNAENINNAIRDFQANHGHYVRGEKSGTGFIVGNDRVIVINRFSHHLAQVSIYCKDKFLERLKSPSDIEDGLH